MEVAGREEDFGVGADREGFLKDGAVGLCREGECGSKEQEGCKCFFHGVVICCDEGGSVRHRKGGLRRGLRLPGVRVGWR